MKISTSIAVLSGLLLSGAAGESQAAPVNYLDTYWGGDDGGYNIDVMAPAGDTSFQISSMDVERVANNLVVVINTNYSGSNVGALGTNTTPLPGDSEMRSA